MLTPELPAPSLCSYSSSVSLRSPRLRLTFAPEYCPFHLVTLVLFGRGVHLQLHHQHATLCDERDLTWSLEPSGVAGPVPLRSPEPCGIVRSSSRHRAGLRKTDYVQKFRAATACRLAVASTHYTPPRHRASMNLSVGASVTLYVCGSVALCVCASVPLSVCPSLSWRTYLKTSLQVRLTLRRVAPLTRPPRGPRCRFGCACRMQAHAGGNGPVQGITRPPRGPRF